MPTDNPRVQITLDESTNGLLASLAKKYDKSVSATAADLIRDSLEQNEDLYFAEISNERHAKDDGKRFSHDEAWG